MLYSPCSGKILLEPKDRLMTKIGKGYTEFEIDVALAQWLIGVGFRAPAFWGYVVCYVRFIGPIYALKKLKSTNSYPAALVLIEEQQNQNPVDQTVKSGHKRCIIH